MSINAGHVSRPLALVLAWGLGLMLTSCGGTTTTPGGSGGATGALTPITTGAQGAQAASSAEAMAAAVSPMGARLSDTASRIDTAINAVPVTVIPVTFDCTSRSPILGGGTSTPNSITIVKDFSGRVTGTLTMCRVNATETSGTITATKSGSATTLTLGSTGAPLIVSEYIDTTFTTVKRKGQSAATLTYSISGATITLTANGSVETWDYLRHKHDHFDLTGLSITDAKSTTAVGANAYTVDTLTFDGALSRTVFVSDIDPTVSYTEGGSFTSFVVVYETPAAGSAATVDYLTINGQLSVATNPARCIDGTFAIATNTPISIDATTGMTTAGQLTVNTTAMATFNADGSISLALNSGAPQVFTTAALATLCAL